MLVTSPERIEDDGFRASAPSNETERDPTRRVTAIHVLLAILTLDLAVTAAFSDLSGSGRVLAVMLLLGCGGGSALLYANGGRFLRVVLCAGIGTLGVAHTVGIALNRTTRTGLEAGDVLFVPALLASIALLLLAVTCVISGRTWRATALAVPCALLFVYYVVGPVTLGTWATHRVAEDPSGRTPSDVGLVYEDLRLEAADGTPLAAWYVPSRNGAAIIVRHGASSSREAVLDHLAVLARAGYGVLAMDARGHGESGGESNAFGWYAQDVSVGVDHLIGRPEVRDDAIGVLGMSMGGEEAITAAATDERLRAVVAEGVTMRTAEDFLAIDKGLAMWLSAPHYWVMYTTADLLSDADPPPSLVDAVAAAAPRPILLIAAGDVDVEQRLGARFVAHAPATTQLWVVAGAGHTDGLRAAPREWSERVLGVFDAALAPGATN